MKVKDLIKSLQSLDQEKNIFLVYDRFEFLPPEVEVLTDSELDDFRVPDYLLKSLSDDDLPSIGDYFFDAY